MKSLITDEKAKKIAARAAKIGFVLALLCHLLPHDYRVVCSSVVKICTTGGL